VFSAKINIIYVIKSNFINDEDVYQQIKQDLLLDIIADQTERQKKIKKAEAAVLKQIRSKAGKWYDMDAVLVNIKQWVDTKLYAVGESVYDDGIIYNCTVANTNMKPSVNATEWLPTDPRHDLLVMYVCDMILYHLHSSVNSRKIPDIRKERYKEAVGWLEMVADRTESPDFTEADTDSELVIWGSNEKQENYY